MTIKEAQLTQRNSASAMLVVVDRLIVGCVRHLSRKPSRLTVPYDRQEREFLSYIFATDSIHTSSFWLQKPQHTLARQIYRQETII